MQKIVFVRDVRPSEVAGAGPSYKAGDCYLMKPTSAERWKRRGAAQDAPADMKPLNEPPSAPPARGDHSRSIVQAGHGKWNVLNHEGKKINREPMKKAAAEAMRDAGIGSKVGSQGVPGEELPIDALLSEPEQNDFRLGTQPEVSTGPIEIDPPADDLRGASQNLSRGE